MRTGFESFITMYKNYNYKLPILRIYLQFRVQSFYANLWFLLNSSSFNSIWEF
jgi:hypothetical protein